MTKAKLMKISASSYRSIIKASGLYDALLMLPFAIPGLVVFVFQLIIHIHLSFSLSGFIPDFSPFHLLFVNIMASVSIVWAVLRITTPQPCYALYDSIMRFIIACLMMFYIQKYDVTQLMYLFLFAELIWAILQLYFYFNNDDELDFA